MTTTHVLIIGLAVLALIAAALPLARRAVLLLTTKYLVKRRLAWVSLMAVALCVALVLIVLSVMSGWLEAFRSSFRSMTGDLIVSRGGSMGGFAHYEEIIKDLEAQPEVAAACPLIRTAALLSFPQVSGGWKKYVEVIGVPGIDRLDRVMPFSQSLWLQHNIAPSRSDNQPLRSPPSFKLWDDVDYKLAVPNDRRPLSHPGMIAGMGAIAVETDRKTGRPDWQPSLRYMLGQVTVVPSGDSLGATSGQINASTTPYWIVDGSQTKTTQHDRNVYVPFAQLQRDLDLAEKSGTDVDTGERVVTPARATEIHIKLKPGVDYNAYRAKAQQVVDDGYARAAGLTAAAASSGLATDATTSASTQPAMRAFGDLIVETWEDQQRTFLNAVENEITIMMVLFGVISLVAVFMIFCIFYTIVAEKTRDVGILKSVGASGWNVAQIFLTYGAAIGFVGGSLGVGLGWLFLRYINEINEGIGRLTGTPVYNAEVYALDKLPTTIDWREAIIIWIIGILAAIVGAIVPAIRAARLNAVEALRFE